MQATNQPFQHYTEEEHEIQITELTPLQKEEAEQARKQHRLNMTKKQKGFKGERAFIAKPAEIAFRDFTVGKPHYLLIILTNVSNASISFNVLPLPQKIRNYFQVEYVPKGKISPGITNEIRFKFFPQINEDIFSEFTIQAETGNISFPIICTSRKTIIHCQESVVDFGRIIFGQSKKARLLIRNEGSLPSQFSLLNRNNTQIGTNNSSDEMAIISNLQFDKRGDISANTEKSIFFDFSPKNIGPFQLSILLVAKNGLHSPPISLSLQGQCVEVPVRVQKTQCDLEICLLGHVYRQKIRFYNKSEGPMSFKMVQPPQTKKYFQFNPIIGYIQKQSALDVWVKFTAEKDIVMYLSKFMKQKNVYCIPFEMSVKEQILPVQFELKFKITTDRVTIRPPQLNFGKVFEGLSSKIEVQLQNQSQLPQQILLTTKKSIYLENDQPLFKLLPLQTIKTYFVYRSKRLQDSKNYREQDYIGCKIITGEIATKKIDIHYFCEVSKPDLDITNNKIDLPALQVGQITQAVTSIKNNTNKEIIFEVFVPEFEACGLKITPAVKILAAKQQIQLNVEYHSFFKTMSVSLLNQIAQRKKPKPVIQEKKLEEMSEKKQNKKQAKKQAKLTKQQQQQLELEQKRLEEEQRVRKEKEEQARIELQRNFNAEAELTKIGGKIFDFKDTQHYQWLLPVYFKQKDYSDVSAEINFIQITTTSIAQILTINKTEIDFGQIAVGTRTVRELIILNLGPKATLKKRSIPIFSSFNILNSLKQVETGKPFRAVIEFQPIQEQRFEHRLQFYTQKYSVSCKLKGKGVRPEIQTESQNGLINMGAVILQQSSEKTVKIKNVCNFEVMFMFEKVGGGILNSNSGSAFSYIPSHGTIAAHSSVQIKVKFKPDRINEKYYQKMKIHVQQQKEVKYFYLIGSCYPRQAYATLYKQLTMPQDIEVRRKVQYVFDNLRNKDEDTIFSANNKTILLEFSRVTQGVKDEKCFQRKLSIGSCRLLDPKLQKPTNFEILMPKDDRFACDNIKGTANAGTETVVTFSYKPQETDPLIRSIPQLVGMGQWRDQRVQLKLSGGFIKPGVTDLVSLDINLRFYANQL